MQTRVIVTIDGELSPALLHDLYDRVLLRCASADNGYEMRSRNANIHSVSGRDAWRARFDVAYTVETGDAYDIKRMVAAIAKDAGLQCVVTTERATREQVVGA